MLLLFEIYLTLDEISSFKTQIEGLIELMFSH